MAHHGMLRDFRFSSDVDDVRGTNLYGTNDDKLGKIDDVIFDHHTGDIEYAVVDTGGWLSSNKFLVPAERIYPYPKNEDDFAIAATKEQIEALPKYDEDAMKDDTAWTGYDKKYREAWGGGPVMHKEGSTHTITPEASQMPAGGGSGAGDADLMPDRLAGKFPAAGNDSSKIRMRPASAAKAEDTRLPGEFQPLDKSAAAYRHGEESSGAYQQFDQLGDVKPIEEQRDRLTNPDDVYVAERVRHARWTSFEDHLRRNRVDITASCGSCGEARDKVA